tara:strand:+ start:670 stop:939 length:270 start_codon:yes stop_codon:yes gene_type:complete
MAVKPFKIGQHVMMSEEGLRHHGEKYRNTIFKINYVCPVSFNFIGRESEGIVGEHLNDLVEIKDGKESAYLFSDALYDSELIDEAERWK